VWCLGEVGEKEILAQRAGILEDEGPVQVYRSRRLETTTVGSLAREILSGPGASDD
jgi:hypothetical protein